VDIDFFNERTVEAWRAASLAEMMRSLESAHAEATSLLGRTPDEVLAGLNAEKRVRVWTPSSTTCEHTEAISV